MRPALNTDHLSALTNHTLLQQAEKIGPDLQYLHRNSLSPLNIPRQMQQELPAQSMKKEEVHQTDHLLITTRRI
jgi:hypothetical protein